MLFFVAMSRKQYSWKERNVQFVPQEQPEPEVVRNDFGVYTELQIASQN